METYRLNPKQIAFADEYIITGNLYQSAIKAGYSENYAKGNVKKLLENERVQKYISSRMELIQSEKIMSAEEVLERLTSIARREKSEGVYISRENDNGKISSYGKKYEHVPSVEEQTKALELIGKRYALWTDKLQASITKTPTFIDDISDDEDG